MRPKWNIDHLESFIDEMEAEPKFWKIAGSYGLLGVALGGMMWWGVMEVPAVTLFAAFSVGERVGAFYSRKTFVEKLERDCVD